MTGLAAAGLNLVALILRQIFKGEASADPSLSAWTSDDLTAGLPPDASAAPVVGLHAQAERQVASLREVDPNFSEVAFLDQAAKIYLAVLAAEGAMSADAVAGMVSADFLERLRKRIADWCAAGLRRVVKDGHIDDSMVFKFTIDGVQQAASVRFVGSAVRCTEDTSNDLAVEGSMEKQYFTEFAAFVRPAGSTTPRPVAAGAPAHCPSCGAPAQAESIYCEFCGTPITGSGGTWLLDRISESAYT